MAQPSVISYFNTRKRSAVEDVKSIAKKKVCLLDNSLNSTCVQKKLECVSKNVKKNPTKLGKPLKNQKNIQDFLQTLSQSTKSEMKTKINNLVSQDANCNIETATDIKLSANEAKKKITSRREELKASIMKFQESAKALEKIQSPEQTESVQNEGVTKNAMDKTNSELSLNDIKKALTRSEKLAKLKSSISRFKELDKQLETNRQKASSVEDSPNLKSFKNIELEVQLSPQKVQSPQKLYLSPKKDLTAKRNILNFKSPTKNAVELSFSPSKLAYQSNAKQLYLPYKYKCLHEIFRSIDTVSQIMYNRKETITLKKLKPAVEEMLKKNLKENHLGQIKYLYPEAFDFRQEKLRAFGTGINQEKWELVVQPNFTGDHMTSETLLKRRTRMFQILQEKVKDYHEEFLNTLHMKIPREKLTCWHPEFDIEKIPDIEIETLPQPPTEEKFSSGKEVLEKARTLFHCNTRMEAALERLQETKQTNPEIIPPRTNTPILKGIPKALLEKVRQRQAAKMLQNMTRSDNKEQEIQHYSRLPELARLTRNLFVVEKKSVLPLDIVIDKLNHSFRSFITKPEMEQHLRSISKEAPGWLVFHEIRNAVYIKVSKNADLNLVLNKLECALKEKQNST